ncbi:MAG: iron ABC transporter permease [Candidatus Bathyarchaeia archaeon]
MEIWSRLRREFDLMTGAQTLLAVFILILFLIAPLFLMVEEAFVYKGEVSLKWFFDIIGDTEFVSFESRGGRLFEVHRNIMYIWGFDHGILLNSLLVAVVVTVSCCVIGVIVALIMARYKFWGKEIFRVMLLVPLLATPFVNAYVIGKLFKPTGGLINFIFFDVLHLLPWRIDIDGLFGIALAQILSFYPIVYLNVFATLMNIDPSLEEQAENLGSKGFRLFRSVTLPLSLPGLAAGAIIVFIFSMEDLGAPIGFLGARANPLSRKLVSYQIYSSFAEALAGGISPRTYALAVIMLIISIIGFVIVKQYVSLKSYAMLSRGGRWSPRIRKLPLKYGCVIYIFLVALIIVASMPQIGTVLLATTNWATSGTLPTEFTTKYLNSLATNPDVTRAIFNSIMYSGAAIGIMVLVGASIAYVVARRDIPSRSLLDVFATIPVAVPGIALAVGYFLFFSRNFRGTLLDPLTDPALLLIFSYSVRRLPFTSRAIFAGLQQIDVSLEEASLNIGAKRSTTFLRIVLPMIVSNIVGGGILSFVYSMSEVSTSSTLGALREDRMPITFFISQIVYGVAAVGAVSIGAALCVLLMSIQILAMVISNLILKQRVAFLGV